MMVKPFHKPHQNVFPDTAEPVVMATWSHDLGSILRGSSSPVREFLEQWQQQNLENRMFVFIVCLRDGFTLIGLLRITQYQPGIYEGNLEMKIDETIESKWYVNKMRRLAMQFAFDELRLHRVSAIALSCDIASVRLYQQGGFTLEAQRRQAVFQEDQLCDELHFGLLCSEWQVIKSKVN